MYTTVTVAYHLMKSHVQLINISCYLQYYMYLE